MKTLKRESFQTSRFIRYVVSYFSENQSKDLLRVNMTEADVDKNLQDLASKGYVKLDEAEVCYCKE